MHGMIEIHGNITDSQWTIVVGGQFADWLEIYLNDAIFRMMLPKGRTFADVADEYGLPAKADLPAPPQACT